MPYVLMSIFYLVCLVSPFLSGLQPYSAWLLKILVVLLLVHFVEYLLVRKRLEQAGAKGNHFFGTMMIGFMYWRPLLKAESR